MRKRSSLEEKIYNSGGRVIPGITHDIPELVRHRSSYFFFRRVIELDIASRGEAEPLRIVDLGCGVGHGCEILSELPNVHIVGVDSSAESIEFARTRYARSNITYEIADLLEYIHTMPEFDYVVSRGVLEHLPDGLQLALSAKWCNRLLFDVPYDEPIGRNPHHVLHRIREEAFAEFPEAELFFEDSDGAMYNLQTKPPSPNMIVCVCSRRGLPKANTSSICFPWLASQARRFLEFDKETLDLTISTRIQKVDTVLDIGPGIRPQRFFRPSLHLCCEPHSEYVQILQKRFARSPHTIVLQGTAPQATRLMPDKSVDSVFLIDLIEHLDKDEGRDLLHECERIARYQIVLFTPVGFLPQEYETGEEDAWGLHGGEWQRHRSGWSPDDFDDSWEIWGSQAYHTTNGKGEVLDSPVGAFWAIKNIEPVITLPVKLAVVSDILPPTPSEQSLTLYRLLQDSCTEDYCLLSNMDYSNGDPYEGVQGPHNLLPQLHARYYHLPAEFQPAKLQRFKLSRVCALLMQAMQRASNILHIIKSERCDAIVACSGEFINLLASYLASKWARVPFYAYFFTDHSAQWSVKWNGRLHRFVELILLKGATGVIVNDESLWDKYHRRYKIEPMVISLVHEDTPTEGKREASGSAENGESGTRPNLAVARARFLAVLRPPTGR